MNRIDRNKILVRHLIELGIANSQAELGKLLGYNNSCGFSQLLNEKKPYPKNFTTKLKNLVPSLNTDWLENGVGEMFVESAEDSEQGQGSSDVLPVNVTMETQGNTIPFVNKELATAPNLDISKLVSEQSDTLEVFPKNKVFKGVRYVQTVITMAMAPRYLPGDYLLVGRKCGANILSGTPYLVDTYKFGTMFRIVHILENGYRLEANNPDVQDIFVPFDQIYSISEVLSVVITNISLSTNIHLAELVRKRDEQVSLLSHTQDKMVDSQQQFLSEIVKQNERMEKLVDKLIGKLED